MRRREAWWVAYGKIWCNGAYSERRDSRELRIDRESLRRQRDKRGWVKTGPTLAVLIRQMKRWALTHGRDETYQRLYAECAERKARHAMLVRELDNIPEWQ